MTHDRSFVPSYFLYVSVIGIALAGIALGLTGVGLTGIASGLTVATNQETGLSRQAPTNLDIRMQSLREIQQALAKPLPRPEPLPARTARGMHRVTHAVSYAAVAPKANRRKLMDEARKVFAGIEPTTSDIPSSAYAEPDRHIVR